MWVLLVAEIHSADKTNKTTGSSMLSIELSLILLNEEDVKLHTPSVSRNSSVPYIPGRLQHLMKSDTGFCCFQLFHAQISRVFSVVGAG